MGRSGKTNMKHPGGRYGYRLATKRAEALERQEHRSSCSPQEQLDRLDQRLGEGSGARKERSRLEALVAGDQPKRKRRRKKK